MRPSGGYKHFIVTRKTKALTSQIQVNILSAKFKLPLSYVTGNFLMYRGSGSPDGFGLVILG